MQCRKFPEQFRVAMPKRRDDRRRQTVLGAKPIDPKVEFEKFLLQVMGSEEVPIDRVRWLCDEVRFELTSLSVPRSAGGGIVLVHKLTHPVQRPSVGASAAALVLWGANA